MTNIHKLSGVSSVVDFDKLALLVELQFETVGQFKFVALTVALDFAHFCRRPSFADGGKNLFRDVLVCNGFRVAADFLPFALAVEFDNQSIGEMHIVGRVDKVRILGYERNLKRREIRLDEGLGSRRKLLIVDRSVIGKR